METATFVRSLQCVLVSCFLCLGMNGVVTYGCNMLRWHFVPGKLNVLWAPLRSKILSKFSWKKNKGRKIPFPDTHLLRPERHQPLQTCIDPLSAFLRAVLCPQKGQQQQSVQSCFNSCQHLQLLLDFSKDRSCPKFHNSLLRSLSAVLWHGYFSCVLCNGGGGRMCSQCADVEIKQQSSNRRASASDGVMSRQTHREQKLA